MYVIYVKRHESIYSDKNFRRSYHKRRKAFRKLRHLTKKYGEGNVTLIHELCKMGVR